MTDRCAYSNRLRRLLLPIALLVALLCQPACTSDYEEETALLERAEANFTAGEYDTAVALYQRFLAEHPRSPYANIAQQRLRLIERELDALMGRRGTPTPVHVPQRLPQNLPRRTSTGAGR